MLMMIGVILLSSCGTKKREEIIILLFFICTIMSIIYIYAHYPITCIIHPWLLMRLGPSLDHLTFSCGACMSFYPRPSLSRGFWSTSNFHSSSPHFIQLIKLADKIQAMPASGNAELNMYAEKVYPFQRGDKWLGCFWANMGSEKHFYYTYKCKCC